MRVPVAEPRLAWTEVITRKRRLRDAAISPYIKLQTAEVLAKEIDVDDLPNLSKLPDQPIKDFTDLDSVSELVASLGIGEVTSEQVILAYIHRATVAHQLTNAITEVMFGDGLEQARALDRHIQENGTLYGPLHGVPITVKDQFNVQGYDSTLGYVGRSFSPATEDAVLVQLLKKQGAVILAKTNLPQSIMWSETENPLWGLTTNPRNPAFTPGGSTGGEGTLLALHGTLVGFGTDIGGSVRIPAALMGLYGFKPSSERLPYQGVPVSTEGQEHVPSSVGPMTRSLESIIQIMRLLVNAEPWKIDPRCCPIPWRDTVFEETVSRKSLTIGVMVDDGVVAVHPPIKRTLNAVVAKLRAAGHEVVDWEPTGHAECIAIQDAYYLADGGEDIRRDMAAGGEPYIPHVEALVNRGKAISVYEYWQLNKRKLEAQKNYLHRLNTFRAPSGRLIDVLLTPTMPHTAVPHRTCKWVGYTKVWNVLNYPALSMPFSTVLDKDVGDGAFEPRNEHDAWNMALYDPESMRGHPVSLQLVGRRLEEERVLGAAVVVERVWRG